jgi:hypothetical protein
VSEGWTALIDAVYSGSDKDLMLRGPGTTPGIQPYMGIRTYRSVPSDYYNYTHYAMTGYDSGVSVWQQPGVNSILGNIGTLLWNNSIPYYLCVNKRRIQCLVNVDGIWQHFYAGFFLAFGTPAQYPFPQYLGASVNAANQRYSTTAAGFRGHLSFPEGVHAMMWDPLGQQRQIGAGTTDLRLSPAQNPAMDYSGTAPPYTISDFLPEWTNMRPFYNEPNEFFLMPCILYRPYRYIAGQLDGCYKVPGFSNSSGDVVQIGSKYYVMFQDAYRIGFADYCAMLLE